MRATLRYAALDNFDLSEDAGGKQELGPKNNTHHSEIRPFSAGSNICFMAGVTGLPFQLHHKVNRQAKCATMPQQAPDHDLDQA